MSDLHVIVGLGATGFSCAHYLKEKGINFAITDTRPNPPNLAAFEKEFPGVEISLGQLDHSLLNRAKTIVLSPGIALSEPEITAQVKRGAAVIGDIELFAQAVNVPVIAITGTNAKSTVTTIVGNMLQAAGFKVQVGGNLGVPALDLLRANPKAEAFVLELSSFQLETTYSLRAKVASILNITPDHMDRYRDLAEYRAAKQRIYQHCQLAICNRDDPLTDYKDFSPKLTFTLDEPGKKEFGLKKQAGNSFLAYEDQLLLASAELPVMGKHYQANALASLAIGYGFGLAFEPMLSVLREFKGLPHRCQFIRERNQVRWYNDSKGTNIGATEAAIQGLGSEIAGKIILIAGGVGKSADFSTLVPTIKKYSRHVVLIGQAAEELASVIGNNVPVSFAKTMDDAVEKAAQKAQANDSVLLSPACASFDMFNNYEHRGDVFMEIVKRLV